MNNFFKKGSEWRKWDLHIHTKGTNKNDNFDSADFDSFCDKRKIFLILAISCLLKPSFDGLILLTNFLTFL
jgi:hypothetical protein